MINNIIPGLVSIETDRNKIDEFYFGENSNIYDKINKQNPFHYKVYTDDNITLPKNYDFRNGHFYKKGNIYYFCRKIGLFELKFSFDVKQRIFLYNKLYSYLPFEIGHIFPPGRHLADLIALDLFLKGFIFIRGCAAFYQDKYIAFIAPSYNGKTSLIEQIIDKGGKYIAEEFFIYDIGSESVFSTPCLVTDERLINKKLKQKLFQYNMIQKVSHIDKFILYLNQETRKYRYKERSFFDFVILRSLFFLKNDFVKSYIFTENVTEKLAQVVGTIKNSKITYKTIYINNYQFDNLLKDVS